MITWAQIIFLGVLIIICAITVAICDITIIKEIKKFRATMREFIDLVINLGGFK